MSKIILCILISVGMAAIFLYAGYLQAKMIERKREMNNVLMIYFKNGEIAKFEEVGNIETYTNELRFDYRFQNSVYHAKFYLATIGGYTYTTIIKSV
ncbi:MAG TPA: hypothetical protein IAA34_07415 [Candidatus Enterococcus stercoripullorum]|nr:hypothetical protein [Candidatus Enterococcus stercoripullorum]